MKVRANGLDCRVKKNKVSAELDIELLGFLCLK